MNEINKLTKMSKRSEIGIDSLLRNNRFKLAKSHNKNGYSQHSMPDKKYKKAKCEAFGNRGAIFGVLDDDYNSCDTI